MKKIALVALMGGVLVASCNTEGGADNSSTSFSGLNSKADSLSYFIGSNMAEGLSKDDMIDYFSDAAFIKGFNDKKAGDSLILQPQDGMALAQRLSQEKQMAKQETEKGQYADKIAAGEAFLNAKSNEADVITLPSGLRYKVLKEGTGEKPQLTDVVSTHYHGTLIDGTVFDSSVERGEPAKFPVGQVIAAWTEALQLMPVGSKWQLYCPSDIAYGAREAGPSIGPYETLIFDVELLEIVKQ